MNRLAARILFAALAALGTLQVQTMVQAQTRMEVPLGLVLDASKVDLHRAGDKLGLTARAGDILFSGDSLEAKDGSARFLDCSASELREVSGALDVSFGAREVKIESGAAAPPKPGSSCALGPMERSISAARQDGAAEASRSIQDALTGTLADRVQALAPADRQALQAALDAADRALAASSDPVPRLAKAAALEKYGLLLDAAAEMRTVTDAWPNAAWARSRMFSLETRAAIPRAAIAPPEADAGKNTFAVLIGISSFKSDQIRPLEYAHADAIELRRLLMSPRGGGLPDENIKLLTNQEATFANIRSAIDSQLKGRRPIDTVLLFVASHGTAIGDRGYIIAWDTDPQDVPSTSIEMEDIRKFFETELGGVRRLLLYVDVCRAGKIGQIVPEYRATNKVTARLEAGDNFFGMLAAQQGQSAVEGVNYGGGHGAFSYFLMRALNGDADVNHDGKVTMNELVDFVHDKVAESTGSQQIPKAIGEIDERRVMAYTALEGVDLQAFRGPMVDATRGGARGLAAPIATPVAESEAATNTQLKYDADLTQVMADFHQAIREKRMLPAQDNGAFRYLAILKVRLSEADYASASDELRVALEDRGQELLSRYLAGDQDPPKSPEFFAGAQDFEAAELLARDSVFLEARKTFCEGRVKAFAKDWNGAQELLERSIRLDPSRGYAYNALGIAFLERADYAHAEAAFRDAIARAPYWAYPLHNLALTYFQTGDYASAIAAYQQAIQLAPQYAYLPYNLGLVYQRINRLKDAEAMYRKALAIRADAAAYNALGYLRFFEKRPKESEDFYKRAIAKAPDLTLARHNYAVLLDSLPARRAEAWEMWRGILRADPDYTLARVALARSLAQAGRDSEAAGEYRALLDKKPDYPAARVALGDLSSKMGDHSAALFEYGEAVRLDPEDAATYEKIGDLKSDSGDRAGASAAYQSALNVASDAAMKRRIRRKLRP